MAQPQMGSGKGLAGQKLTLLQGPRLAEHRSVGGEGGHPGGGTVGEGTFQTSDHEEKEAGRCVSWVEGDLVSVSESQVYLPQEKAEATRQVEDSEHRGRTGPLGGSLGGKWLQDPRTAISRLLLGLLSKAVPISPSAPASAAQTAHPAVHTERGFPPLNLLKGAVSG